MNAATWFQLLICHCCLVSIDASSPTKNINKEDPHDVHANDAASARSRAMATLGVTTTMPSNPRIGRRQFPSSSSKDNNNNNPHVCLAFLSCCGRTDLLNHTLAGGKKKTLISLYHIVFCLFIACSFSQQDLQSS